VREDDGILYHLADRTIPHSIGVMRLEGRKIVATPQQFKRDVGMSVSEVDRGYTLPRQNRSDFDVYKCHFGEGGKV